MSTDLLNLHRSYDPASGLFSVKRDCDEVAGLIRSMMGRRFNDFNPLAVESNGKRNQHWIEFPRIHKHWHPTGTDAKTLAAELLDVAILFKEIYQVKEETP